MCEEYHVCVYLSIELCTESPCKGREEYTLRVISLTAYPFAIHLPPLSHPAPGRSVPAVRHRRGTGAHGHSRWDPGRQPPALRGPGREGGGNGQTDLAEPREQHEGTRVDAHTNGASADQPQPPRF